MAPGAPAVMEAMAVLSHKPGRTSLLAGPAGWHEVLQDPDGAWLRGSHQVGTLVEGSRMSWGPGATSRCDALVGCTGGGPLMTARPKHHAS